MTEPTDKTIEILCAECSQDHIEHYEVGVQAMFEHILDAHPQYNQHEADVYALEWAETAYDRIDEENERLTKAYQHEKRHRAFWGHK